MTAVARRLVSVLIFLGSAVLAYLGSLLVAAIALTFGSLVLYGVIRNKSWGIAIGQIYCWMALIISFALSIPSHDFGEYGIIEAILDRHLSQFENYVLVFVAASPWLICMFVLGKSERLGEKSSPT